MRSVVHDMGTPNVPPVGLGWLLMPFGPTTVLSHSGASPGGVALLAVVPEHDLVFAASGNDPRAMALHDQILLWLLRQHLDVEVPDLALDTVPASDLAPYAGTYRSNQLRVDITAVDGGLEERMTYEPLDPGPAAPLRTRRQGPVRAGRDAARGVHRILAPAPRLLPRGQRRPAGLQVRRRPHHPKRSC